MVDAHAICIIKAYPPACTANCVCKQCWVFIHVHISAWASVLLVLNTMGIAKASYFAERVMITDSHAESYTIP